MELYVNKIENVETSAITLDEASIKDFLSFLNDKEEYLESGLGAFHTDDHSNW